MYHDACTICDPEASDLSRLKLSLISYDPNPRGHNDREGVFGFEA